MSSNIICGKNNMYDVIAELERCAFVVTDTNVAALYPDIIHDAYVIKAGERSKTPETLFDILAQMQKRGLKRGDTVGAIGGGVVSDITGLASAMYMRGVKWSCIPTSLLAMVDAGIGGKTAVDFNGVKNLIGAFHEPRHIVVCAQFLKTLPEREWVCGTGELIKTCLLTKDAYSELADRFTGLSEKDPDEVYSLIQTCVRIKNAVVKADPFESNLRKILNVGHTVGHALESVDGYRLSHGEYVIKGMMMEAAMCKDIIDDDFYHVLIKMLKMFTSPPRTTAKVVCERAGLDKKNVGNTISFMIVAKPGDIMDVRMEHADFVERYNEALKELKD